MPEPEPRRHSQHSERVLQLSRLVTAAIIALTAVPLAYRAPSLSNLYTVWNTDDVWKNVLLYIPLGLVSRYGLGRTVALAAAVSTISEALQFFAPERFPGFLDLAANVMGAAIGRLLSLAASREGVGFHEITVTGKSGWPFAILAILGTGTLLPFPREPHLRGWDPSFKLAFGDEINGSRRWNGRIEEAVILPQRIQPATVARLARSTGAIPDEVENIRPVFRLPHPVGTAGLPRVEEDAVSRAVYQAVTPAGEFTILLRFRSANVHQKGPARIMTFSRDQYRRNFTIGQQRQSIDFRLRTALTGPDGSDPATGTPAVLAATGETFLAAVFDGRHVRLFVDGGLAADSDLTLRPVLKGFPALTAVFFAGAFSFVALAIAFPGKNSLIPLSLAIGLGGLVLLPFTASFYQQPPPVLFLFYVLGIAGATLSLSARRDHSGNFVR